MDKLKTCIIFAVSVFDADKMYVLTEFMDTFKNHFFDCDLYIGINYNSCLDVESIIEAYGLNTYVSRLINSELYTRSDASAYQLALKSLKESKKTYDIYWFAHTKGAVNFRPNERKMYLTEMFANRKHIESIFSTNNYLGSYGLRGVSRSAGQIQWSVYNKDHELDICSNIISNNLPYTHVNWSYMETMYVMNKQSIETFLSLSTDTFYNTKIQEPCYFEVIFPWIATRCGYFPYIQQSDCFFGERSLKDITNEWIQNNNLHHLNAYLNL